MSHVHKALRQSFSLTTLVRSFLIAAIITLILPTAETLITSNRNVFAQNPSEDEVIRLRTDFVIAPAVVTNARGQRVSGLGQSDFELRSDGHEVKVDYFSAGTERVALLLALDISGSTREILSQQHDAALALLSRFGRGSRVAVLYFGETAKLALPFTTDTNAVSSALNLPNASEPRTAIFDAAATALRAFDSGTADPAERRIVVLLSDGLDNASGTRAAAVIKEARERGVSFYVIHLALFEPRDGRLQPRRPAKGFRELAEQTGGKYFLLGDVEMALNPHLNYNLAPVFKAIEEDLQGQYVLGFYPAKSARDNRFHQIEVALSPRHKNRLRVRSLRAGFVLRSQ
ncbi:MAG TPA: VWA domain-containing protein [Pyrinomonadaceae bacterium]|nr:VWA domain-containing protein [Pyrinomonadaceae bacterium]